MKKVCIIGAGVVGSSLAKKLAVSGYEIAVIDKNGAKIEDLTSTLDIMGIDCDATEVGCLDKVKDFELFIVVTDSDERNIAIAAILKSFFKKEKIIIRVSKNAFAAPPIKELLGVEPVNILTEVITKIIDTIRFPFARSVVRFEKGKLILLNYMVSSEDIFAGKQIKELQALRKLIPFTIAALERDGKVTIPDGDTIVYPGDSLFFVIKEEDIKVFQEHLLKNAEPVRLAFILGHSKFTVELLKRIADFEGLKIKLVEPDLQKCEEIAGEFPNIDVLHGEVTDVELLKSEGIDKAGLVIAITEDEENNVLSCILAKKLGAKKAAALIAHSEYENIIESIGIDTPIVPRKLLASRVYTTLSSKSLLDVFELRENIEILEMQVGSEWDGKQISEIKCKECPLVLALKRGNDIQVVGGDTVVKKGDILICIRQR
ncbi:NAD-binding protein [Desulfurobacterium sp.]